MIKLLLTIAMIFALLSLTYTNSAGCCTSGCQTDDCWVTIDQCSDEWRLNISCGGASSESWYGSGQYSGTICNGYSPCSA